VLARAEERPDQCFSDLVEEHLRAGFFTHVYAEAGLLTARSPSFSWFHEPGGMDIYDLSSLTKALATTVLSFQAADSYHLRLEDRVEHWLRESLPLPSPLGGFTIQSLLRHEAGFAAWTNAFTACGQTRRSLLAILQDAARSLPHVGHSVYSDIGFLLLGEVLERLDGVSLRDQFDSLCGDILRLDRREFPIGFLPDESLRPRCVETSYCPLRGRWLKGEVHDENCWALGGATGHAGLFGSGRAVGEFLRHLAGSRLGSTVLRENAAALASPPNEPLMGWRQAADFSSETFGGGYAMGHMGFTGTAFWVEPKSLRYAVLLTNRVRSSRISPLTRPFRRRAFEILWKALK
jgi:CubicO group peptidase (beta-lactamase class C family)